MRIISFVTVSVQQFQAVTTKPCQWHTTTRTASPAFVATSFVSFCNDSQPEVPGGWRCWPKPCAAHSWVASPHRKPPATSWFNSWHWPSCLVGKASHDHLREQNQSGDVQIQCRLGDVVESWESWGLKAPLFSNGTQYVDQLYTFQYKKAFYVIFTNAHVSNDPWALTADSAASSWLYASRPWNAVLRMSPVLRCGERSFGTPTKASSIVQNQKFTLGSFAPGAGAKKKILFKCFCSTYFMNVWMVAGCFTWYIWYSWSLNPLQLYYQHPSNQLGRQQLADCFCHIPVVQSSANYNTCLHFSFPWSVTIDGMAHPSQLEGFQEARPRHIDTTVVGTNMPRRIAKK